MARRTFSDAPAAATAMTLNFSTPHHSVYAGKEVEKVTLPGEGGEFGLTMNHSPIISQLRPGVVQIQHLGVRTERNSVFLSFGLLALLHA